jgi:hypothetical protein
MDLRKMRFSDFGPKSAQIGDSGKWASAEVCGRSHSPQTAQASVFAVLLRPWGLPIRLAVLFQVNKIEDLVGRLFPMLGTYGNTVRHGEFLLAEERFRELPPTIRLEMGREKSYCL